MVLSVYVETVSRDGEAAKEGREGEMEERSGT